MTDSSGWAVATLRIIGYQGMFRERRSYPTMTRCPGHEPIYLLYA